MFADVEAVLVAYLPVAVPSLAGVSTDLPNDLINQLPYAQVTRIGGGDDYITDSAIVDVDIYGGPRLAAHDAARLVHAAMMRLRHTAVNGVLIDLVTTNHGPMWVNYTDENIHRYVASYNIDSRVVAQPN